VRRFFNPWILFVIVAAVLSSAGVWPNPT